MLKASKNKIKIAFIAFLLMNNVFAKIATVTIEKETSSYVMDIKYPQGFVPDSINSAIKQYITQTEKSFLKELSEDEDTPDSLPGKTGINVTFSIPYNTHNAVSVRFDVSIFHKGAAHPLNTVTVHNFIQGKKVELNDLFLTNTTYLNSIAQFCKQVISKKKSFDANWIAEGTKPTRDNYSTWYFTSKGIAIVFDTYQVAAYVYGPQTVTVPLSIISSLLKPELRKSLWGN